MNALTMAQITRGSSPVEVATALTRPAARRTDPDWWLWPNIISGFHLAVERRLATPVPFPEPTTERGIVIVGGGKYLPCVYVSVRVLRHLGCRLPIEVWHLDGEDEPTLTEAIAGYGVDFINADELARTVAPFRFLDWHWWKGWQLKSYALCQTRFRQVLLLDADCYPVRNPDYLFDWPDYRQTGAVFWPDLENSPTGGAGGLLDFFQLDHLQGRLAESGQMLVDRSLCWRPLQLAAFYNECADLVYHYVYGDKDTFPFAWNRAGVPYARMWPDCISEGDCLLQLDFHGHVVFQHRVSDKFKLTNRTFDSTPQPRAANQFHAVLAHESFCFYVLDELRRLTEDAQASLKGEVNGRE